KDRVPEPQPGGEKQAAITPGSERGDPQIGGQVGEAVSVIEIAVAKVRIEAPAQGQELQRFASHEDDGRGEQAGNILADHQNVAADGSQKIEMQALVEQFAAKQVHEDSQAAEEDCQSQIEELKHAGEDDRVFTQALALSQGRAGDLAILKSDVEIVRAIGVAV